MEVKIIKTKKQYKEYLDRLNEIFDAKKGTPESDEFDLLALISTKMSSTPLRHRTPWRPLSL